VPTTVYRRQQGVFTCEFYCRANIGATQTSGNKSRFAVNHSVPDGTRFIVAIITDLEKFASERFSKSVNSRAVKRSNFAIE
jgi:hypothetical protein